MLRETMSAPSAKRHRSGVLLLRTLLSISLLISALVTVSEARAASLPLKLCAQDKCIEFDVSFPLNEAERTWCTQSRDNLLDCAEAYGLHAARGADDAQNRLWPDTDPNRRDQRDWERDAFRHCYWSARMRIAMVEEMARGFLTRHETLPCNPRDERVMDENNNESGLSIGADILSTVPQSGPIGDVNQERYVRAEATCDRWVREGNLAMIRDDAYGNHEVFYPHDGQVIYSGLHIMPVGDSITHGNAGDFTWRYRLLEHLRANGIRYDFVGPNKMPLNGSYAVSGWDSDHAAKWGQAAFEAADLVYTQVSDDWPDVLLVDLGTNDLTWWGGSASDARDSINRLITAARKCRPDIDIVLAQIGDTGPMDDAKAQQYSQLIAQVVASQSNPRSRLATANVYGMWNWSSDTYDQTHPNVRGEYVIAKAFADALSGQLGYGPAFGPIPQPDVPPVPPPGVAQHFDIQPRLIGQNGGFIAKWDRVPNTVWTFYKVEIYTHPQFGGVKVAESELTPNVDLTFMGSSEKLKFTGTYHVVLVAQDWYGQTSRTAPIELNVVDYIPAPLPPTNVRLSSTDIWRSGNFTVTWDRVPNPGVWTTYKVEVRTHPAFGGIPVWTSPEPIAFELKETYPGGTLSFAGDYHVVVVAEGGGGRSESAPVVLHASTPPPPPAPVITRIVPNPIGTLDKFTVGFTRAQQPGVYTEYRMVVSPLWGFNAIWDMPNTTPNTEIQYGGPGFPGTGVYSVTVIARDSFGQEMASSPVNITVDH